MPMRKRPAPASIVLLSIAIQQEFSMPFKSTHPLSIAVAAVLVTAAAPTNADEPGLAILMERIQTYTHKLQLSIEAGNAQLADFYLHELEETSEYVVEEIESYDGHAVGPLMASMLLPALERLEKPLKSGAPDAWPAVEQRFGEVIRACNDCHVATDHGYVRITPAASNPFPQDFSPLPD